MSIAHALAVSPVAAAPLRFTLANGRVVQVDAMNSARTYPHLTAGLPIEQVNDGITYDLLDRAMNRHGCGAVCMPVRTDSGGFLPPIAVTMLLTSDRPVRQGAGSRLAVVWFREELDGDASTAEAVAAVVRSLRWEEFAEDTASAD